MLHDHDDPLARHNVCELVKLMRSSGHVRRCHVSRIIGEYDVSQHCWQALTLLLTLHARPSLRLVKAVQFHDNHERFTGDVPSPSKWNRPDLAAALSSAEHDVNDQLGLHTLFSSLSEEEQWWLLGVDVTELMMWCADQLAMGNTMVTRVFHNCRRFLRENWKSLPENLQCFLFHWDGETMTTGDLDKTGTVRTTLPDETLVPGAVADGQPPALPYTSHGRP